MIIGYGKLGRVVSLTHADASNVGGDVEVINLLSRLMDDGHEIHLLTPSRGTIPDGVVDHYGPGGVFEELPRLNGDDRELLIAHGGPASAKTGKFIEVLNRAIPFIRGLDDHVIWLGEHNGPAWVQRKVDDSGFVRAYASRLNLVYPFIHAVNRGPVDPLWLCPDPRNVLSCSTLDPARIKTRVIPAQYDTELTNGVYRYGAVELMAVDHLPVPDSDPDPTGRALFGALINEGQLCSKPLGRRRLIGPWLLDLGGELFGKWRSETMAGLPGHPPVPESVPVADVPATARRWRATITLPANAGGWATAKPWEMFASDTVCFAHPAYDDQDHIYGWFDDPERDFLRPRTPDDLRARIGMLAANDDLWTHIVISQREVLADLMEAWDRGYKMIDEMIGGRR